MPFLRASTVVLFKPREGWSKDHGQFWGLLYVNWSRGTGMVSGSQGNLSTGCSCTIRTLILGVPEDKDCGNRGGQEEQVDAEEQVVHHVAELHPQVNELGPCQS